MNGLNFTEDWFTPYIPMWTKYVLPRLERRRYPVRFLEIGSFEGRSACWLLQNVLTNPHDRITCVDPFGSYDGLADDDRTVLRRHDNYEAVFDANMEAIEAGQRLDKRKGLSHEVLRRLPLDVYDGCYIDGSHYTRDVLRDAVLAFDLVRVGGFVLFDDYTFAPTPDQVVQEAIDTFLSIYHRDVKLIFHSLDGTQPQVMVERVR